MVGYIGLDYGGVYRLRLQVQADLRSILSLFLFLI